MKIQIFSDVHFDVDAVNVQLQLAPDTDVLVVAGDVCEGAENSLVWLRQRFGPIVPIVMVAGNHTFYRRFVKDEIRIAREAAKAHNIFFLEDSVVILCGVRFVGCTLWTDYCLMGEPFRAYAMREAASKMMDHKRIAWQKQPWLRFKPQEAFNFHKGSLKFLASIASESFSGKTILVTHHAPSIQSIDRAFRSDLLSAAYASNLEDFIEKHRPDIWIHGHTHNSSDYFIHNTRVICNPHGYGKENPNFDPIKIVEI